MCHSGLSQQRERRLDYAQGCPDLAAIGSLASGTAIESSKQLVGTIEEMETHDNDPIDDAKTDPWDKLGEQFASLREKLKDTYRQQPGADGPTDDEVRDAFHTLGRAWDRLTDAVGTAVRDEGVRQQAKQAATGFFEAVGTAFSQLGSELRRSRSDEEDTSDPGMPPAS